MHDLIPSISNINIHAKETSTLQQGPESVPFKGLGRNPCGHITGSHFCSVHTMDPLPYEPSTKYNRYRL